MSEDQERRIAEMRERYGQAVETWCRRKADEEGEIPSEDRVARLIKPSDRPPPPA